MMNILQYLSDLEANNNREWYHAHKEQYQEANAEFEQLLGQLINAIGGFDSSVIWNNPKELTFKLGRDTRFSHDKSPFNPKFRAHISSGGKLPIPVGYYIVVAPGNRSFLGGGLFAYMFKDATDMIRDYITENGDEWEAIVKDKDFSARFTVKGETLKKVPAGYDTNHSQAEYLKNKSWYLQYTVPDSVLADAKFVEYATEIFACMKPFNDYLNEALKGFKMPTR
jgi:uncharacterized protein (TIGR02453 family)